MTKVEESKTTIKLYIEVKEVKTKDGKKFNAYKTPIGKLNLDVKFNKGAVQPKESGYYEFATDEINLNTKGDYPCLWIKK